jgi:hypothetical protein
MLGSADQFGKLGGQVLFGLYGATANCLAGLHSLTCT